MLTPITGGSPIRTTAWQTLNAVSGTGTSVATGSESQISLVGLPSLVAPPTLEVELTIAHEGGTGRARGFVRLFGWHVAAGVNDNSDAGNFSTGYLEVDPAQTNPMTRRVYVTAPLIFQSGASVLGDRIRISLKGVGTEADTEFEVSGRARLHYQPVTSDFFA